MKIGDLVKYVYNTDHTDLLGIGIITDTGKNNSAAPKNIQGNPSDVYYVRWRKISYITRSGWYPSTCLEIIL